MKKINTTSKFSLKPKENNNLSREKKSAISSKAKKSFLGISFKGKNPSTSSRGKEKLLFKESLKETVISTKVEKSFRKKNLKNIFSKKQDSRGQEIKIFSFHHFIMFFSLLFLIFLDLLSKFIAKNFLEKQINIISDLFFLKFVKNPGIAFSIIIPPLFLKIMTIILIFGIVYYYIKEERKKENYLIDTSFIFILAGALGNAYERIFIGEVVDFIGIKYFSVFNFADIYISLGVVFYLYKILLGAKKIHFDQEK